VGSKGKRRSNLIGLFEEGWRKLWRKEERIL